MHPDIPLDIYDSPAEMIILLPLWGVDKDSIQLSLDQNRLIITAQRKTPEIKPSLTPLSQQCYRWSFEKKIDIPPTSFFNGIHSRLTPENILIITVPKVMVPESISIDIE